MIDPNRRVYTPPLEAGEYAGLPGDEEGGAPRRAIFIALIAIIVIAMAAVAWNIYGGYGPPPLITAESGDIKTVTPQAAPPVTPNHELDDAIARGASPQSSAEAGPAPAPAVSASAAAPLASVLTPSSPQARGAFLAQLAALRSEDDADTAWRAFGARAPDLVRGARLQIQRADLGAQGIYYRLRVGYFDTHERAGAYCARAEAAGQDCMVVSR